MEWLQILSLFLANAGLIIWFRKESINDWIKMEIEIKEFRQLVLDEMKDFHGRLCAIEERNKKSEGKK